MEQPDALSNQITQQVMQRTGVNIVAATTADAIMLSGIVPSRRDREVAETIASSLAGGKRIQNLLEIENTLPPSVTAEPSSTRDASGHSDQTTQDEIVDNLNPEFTGQAVEMDPTFASGDFIFEGIDPAEPDTDYFFPVDPPVIANAAGNMEVVNGFAADDMDDLEPELSAEDDIPGDEALIEAIQRELHQDSATTDLRITVQVEEGVAYLRGGVPHLADARNAEDVASRIPGVAEVVEELDIEDI